MSRSNDDKSKWLATPDYSNYYNDWDPVARSRAAPSQMDALPPRSPSPPRARAQSNASGISRYYRDPSSTSRYREGKQTWHTPTSRDWTFTDRGGSTRQQDTESHNRSRFTIPRKPLRTDSALFSPGVDVGTYSGGYGGSSSAINRSHTVRVSSKRDSTYRQGIDVSSYAGGPDVRSRSPGLGRSSTTYAASNRNSMYRAGVDLSTMAGGPSMSPHGGSSASSSAPRGRSSSSSRSGTSSRAPRDSSYYDYDYDHGNSYGGGFDSGYGGGYY